ncbi:MAG TPA: DUF4348 domain-containing protein [Bacteroidetes bacterium]|nr:DUF4348 domain-containing protein [Bacteroidota bacterium]
MSILNYKHIIIFFISGLIFFSINSCKQNTETKNTENTTIRVDTSLSDLPEDFVLFYNKFSRDSLYQMKHISFPLDGATRAPGSNGDSLIPYHWRRDKWQLHHEFDDFNKIFTRKFIVVDKNLIVEQITGVDGLFKMERRFAKLNDGWNLIYYSVN